jgi:nucleotide sugar dehydrogenase
MATVSVIGIGKLGICFALNLEKCGYNVIGVDIDKNYVNLINEKKLKSYEPYVEEYLKSAKHFYATTDLKKALASEVIFILVQTPSLPNGKYDQSYVEKIIDELISLNVKKPTKHIVISCTVDPGFCDKVAKRLEPLNYTVTYNPEFIAQGSVIADQQNPDMILIGTNSKEAADILEEIYRKMCKNKPSFKRMDRLSAEITKIALNCFITTKISFANSIGDLCEKIGADADKVLDAIGSDSKIGNKCLKYGFGYGGPCLPRDNRAILAFASDNGIDLLISKATDETNEAHLDFQYAQYVANYDKNHPIVFDGITYKKNTVILEESQPLKLAIKLAKNGYTVVVRDRQIVIEQMKKTYNDLFEYKII